QQGIQQGLQQGLQAGQLALIMRQLERRLGTFEPDLQTRINELSIDQLENLSEAILEFTTVQDLMTWLQERN
ncbi:MAG TPA: transposase, partial [Cyanobacteria bacterium UBA11148]|nr:transposase [Cyanobacteria bacterium UBA11148]